MGAVTLDGVGVTPLKRIVAAGGDVMHALRSDDPDFCGFGEAYFSWIEAGAIKPWRLHQRTTLHLVVPLGRVRFVLCLPDQAGPFRVEEVGEGRYCRLTVPPGIVFAFQGLGDSRSLVLSVSDHPHDPDEVRRFTQSEYPFTWQ